MLTPANVSVIIDVITAGGQLCDVASIYMGEVDNIISTFSFSNYGLIAVQFFDSILSLYYKH